MDSPITSLARKNVERNLLKGKARRADQKYLGAVPFTSKAIFLFRSPQEGMDNTTLIRLVAGILSVLCIGVLVFRRKVRASRGL
jgi:hypothetical protein